MSLRKRAIIAAAVIGCGCLVTASRAASTIPNTQFFDWEVPDTYPTAQANIVPVPWLADSTAGGVNAFLATRPAGSTLAVKVLTPLTTPAALNIFKNYKINYVFADFESGTALQDTSNLIKQVQASKTSSKALVGEYELYPISKDKTRPTNSMKLNQPRFNGKAFFEVAVSMANEGLYPGSPGFRNPSSNDSTAPNIRSALFTMPIQRMSMVTGQLKNTAHIPYITRFNNWGNNSLDTDGDPSNEYRFVPGQPLASNPSLDTTDQMLSRNDFRALTLHYRLRGASTLHIFQPGVEGYTKQEMHDDVTAGWNQPQVQSLLTRSGPATLANLDMNVDIVGQGIKSSEETGVVWSGAYTSDTLLVLLSNLDGVAHDIEFTGKIGPHKIMQSLLLPDGTHRLLQFAHVGAYWKLAAENEIFDDPTLSDRNEVGIPEPSTIVAALALGISGLTLRRRRTAPAV